MSDTPTAETCVCGGPFWHKLIDSTLLWCRRCGSFRRIFDGQKWNIPLDRVGDIARSVPGGEDDVPTSPGTPAAKVPRTETVPGMPAAPKPPRSGDGEGK